MLWIFFCYCFLPHKYKQTFQISDVPLNTSSGKPRMCLKHAVQILALTNNSKC